MADQTETLSIRISADGMELFKNGVKLTAEELKGLGDVLDSTSRKQKKMGDDTSAISAHLEKLNSTLVNTAKTLAVAFIGHELLGMVKDMAMLNARYEELGVVQAVVGRNAGYTAHEMEQAALQMQGLGITMIESRNTTVQLAQAQINLADAGKLARIAQDAAVIGATNSSDALNRMIYGIKSAQTDVLRTIGINVSFEQSYKAMANQLGITTEALSENQKMQARENAVLAEGEKLVGAYEAAMGTAGKQMRSMARYFEDLKVLRGEVFNEALTVGVMTFVSLLKDSNQELTSLSNNGKLKEWGEDVASTFAFIVDSGLSAMALIKMVGKTAGYLTAQVFSDNDGKTNEQIAAASNAMDAAYKADMAALLSSTSAMRDALAARRDAKKADADKLVAIELDYSQRSLAVQKAYAGQSLAVQQAAQLALAKGMFPQEFPNKPKDVQGLDKGTGDVDPGKKILNQLTKEYEAATHQVDKYSETLRALNAVRAGVTPQIRAESLALAHKLDQMRIAEQMSAAEGQYLTARQAQRDQADAAVMNTVQGFVQLKDAQQKDLELLGMYPEEIARVTFARKVNLEVLKLQGALAQGVAEGIYTEAQAQNMLAMATTQGNAAIQKHLELLKEQEARLRDSNAGVKDALHDYIKSVSEVAVSTKNMVTNAFKGMEDALVNFVKTGKLDFSSLADSIISDMIRIQVRQSMTGPLSSSGGDGGVAGFLGNLFGGGGNADADMQAGENFYGVKHTGGMVGGDGGWSRSANASVFRGAPRFHGGGITGDEVPIIAKKGEGVFTQGQMKAIGAGMSGGGGTTINVKVVNNTGSQVSVRQQSGGSGMDMELVLDAVDAGMADRIGAGTGQTARAMEGRYGLRTAVS